MEIVTILRHEETVRINPDRLTELFLNLGETAAEEFICWAVEDLAIKISEIKRAASNKQYDLLQLSSEQVAEIATRVGLTSLARVALDVDYCLKIETDTALSATVARLIRIGEMSLLKVWDERDLSV
ncbi:hypothetical protein ACFFUT_14160 [Pseudohalocynthiibacter aestuariivivens]|uniref:Uncharacterized protein n=1 Tax=Pseudohalocynthiibacter aestuariivivens TaxID=1591409 RepID=A0ABV5JHJ5_9RHOB|nr:hypothetical protein [Pseudohalocynthiibacter aestuariivivens]MBS9715365.1 hypothetical protein [Pseudohalocynthiibacter aestuariivivens]